MVTLFAKLAYYLLAQLLLRGQFLLLAIILAKSIIFILSPQKLAIQKEVLVATRHYSAIEASIYSEKVCLLAEGSVALAFSFDPSELALAPPNFSLEERIHLFLLRFFIISSALQIDYHRNFMLGQFIHSLEYRQYSILFRARL